MILRSVFARTSTTSTAIRPHHLLRTTAVFRRPLHSSLPPPPIPPASHHIPDVPTFFTLIGRNCIQHAPKLSSWEQFFTLTSSQLKAAGIEPARDRRYILHWREKFRNCNGEGIVLKEVRRGRKIMGGERRQKEFRAKKRAEENKERKRLEEAEANAEEA